MNSTTIRIATLLAAMLGLLLLAACPQNEPEQAGDTGSSETYSTESSDGNASDAGENPCGDNPCAESEPEGEDEGEAESDDNPCATADADKPATLAEALEEKASGGEPSPEREKRNATVAEAHQELIDGGIYENSISAGDPAPTFTLQDADGNDVVLGRALAKGPVVLLFYRGEW